MSEFSGPRSGWYDPPEGHRPECNCEIHHKTHIEEMLVVKNADCADYECCKDELDSWVFYGLWCRKHGADFMEKKECHKCSEALFQKAV